MVSRLIATIYHYYTLNPAISFRRPKETLFGPKKRFLGRKKTPALAEPEIFGRRQRLLLTGQRKLSVLADGIRLNKRTDTLGLDMAVAVKHI